MVVTCDIQFENNPQATYYAGQVITGKITLTADKVKQVKDTSWWENSPRVNNYDNHYIGAARHEGVARTRYSGHVDYISSLTYLLTPPATGTNEAVLIEPGIHTFSFACHIPINCPSSFEGRYGHIRYMVKVNLTRPWKFDQTFTRALTVLKIMDLNYDSPLLKMPMNTEITKVFCCGPCKMDPLHMHIQLPQTGYVPGQHIPVSVLVTNDTKVPIDEICLRLVMMVCLYSTHPNQHAKNETMTIATLKGDPVLRHCKKHFSYLLPIPATPPTCFNLCPVIKISYRVEVEAKMKGVMYENQCINIPVTIGNVPLQMDGVVVQQQPMPRQFNAKSDYATESGAIVMKIQNQSILDNNNVDPGASHYNQEPWSAAGNIPAPVYMEALHMPQGKLSEDSAHDYGEKNFSPKYPVFTIPSPTTATQNNFDDIDGHIVPPNVTDPNKTTWL